METSKTRRIIGNTMMGVGVVLLVFGLSFVSGLLSGLLGKNLALNEIHLMGHSLFSWGMILLVAGYVLKMYRKGLSKKTKLLVFIPCAIYVLLYLWTLAFPADRIGQISMNSNLLVGLTIIGSLAFWGALLSGLSRMRREVKVLDRVDSTDDKN